MQPIYDQEAVRPMWEELSQCGVMPLKAAADVDSAVAMPGTTLLVVNSPSAAVPPAARGQGYQGAPKHSHPRSF